MAYIASNTVSVYPSTRRQEHQVSARLLSEQSIVNITNKLIETEGFVITPDDQIDYEDAYSNSLEFNIFGYYFVINPMSSITNLFNSSLNIYACINISEVTDDTTYSYNELQGQDINEGTSETPNWIYQGVYFLDTIPSVGNIPDHYLLLCKRDSTTSNWSIPEESRIKFKNTIALGVDGGEIPVPTI